MNIALEPSLFVNQLQELGEDHWPKAFISMNGNAHIVFVITLVCNEIVYK